MDSILHIGGQYWPYLIAGAIVAGVLANGWTWWKERA
jgi:hypothetical protein